MKQQTNVNRKDVYVINAFCLFWQWLWWQW